MSALIETLEGRFVDILALKPENVRIEDIAYGLAMQPRFYGFLTRHYSVAEHSVNVARLVKRRYDEMGMKLTDPVGPFGPKGAERFRECAVRTILRQAILHDADEYLTPDIAYTAKSMPEFAPYKALQRTHWEVIAKRFNVPVEIHPIIHEVDKRMATTEKLALKSDHFPPHWQEYRRQWPEYVGDWNVVDTSPAFPPTHSMIRRRFLDFYETVREA